MGSSASITSINTAPSATCRICLLSSEHTDPKAIGECQVHSWPASEAHRLSDPDADDATQQHSRVHFLMEDRFISPCDCSGTQKFVHLHCLLRWIAISSSANCDVCKATYRGHLAAVLVHPSMQSLFRIHRTLFACCTTNTRYNQLHSFALSLQEKNSLVSFMKSGGMIVQTIARASAPVPSEALASEGSAASQLLALILASRRTHWNCSAFLIVFNRPHAASDGSTALIAVNITQQLPLQECPAAADFHLSSGVSCLLFRGGPCKSNTPLAVLRIHGAVDWRFLFQKAQAVHHQNLFHTWRIVEPPCCFYRQVAALYYSVFARVVVTVPSVASFAISCHS